MEELHYRRMILWKNYMQFSFGQFVLFNRALSLFLINESLEKKTTRFVSVAANCLFSWGVA